MNTNSIFKNLLIFIEISITSGLFSSNSTHAMTRRDLIYHNQAPWEIKIDGEQIILEGLSEEVIMNKAYQILQLKNIISQHKFPSNHILKYSESGVQVDITNALPERMLELLKTMPQGSQSAANCFNAVFYVLGLEQEIQYSENLDLFKTHCRPLSTWEHVQTGDVGLVLQSSPPHFKPLVQHAFLYIDGDMAFDKPGPHSGRWEIKNLKRSIGEKDLPPRVFFREPLSLPGEGIFLSFMRCL